MSSDMGRHGETWGDMGRCGLRSLTFHGSMKALDATISSTSPVSRKAIISSSVRTWQGDMGRYGEIWGDMGRCREAIISSSVRTW